MKKKRADCVSRAHFIAAATPAINLSHYNLQWIMED